MFHPSLSHPQVSRLMEYGAFISFETSEGTLDWADDLFSLGANGLEGYKNHQAGNIFLSQFSGRGGLNAYY